MRDTIIVSVLLALIIFPAGAFAADETDNLVEELNLSTSQIEQIKLQERDQTRLQERLQSQIRLREKELKHELAGDKDPKEAKVQAMVKEINRLRAQSFEEKIKEVMATRKLLTQEQVRQWTRLQLSEGAGTGSQYQNQIRQGGGTSGRDSTGGNTSSGSGGGAKGR